MATYPLRGTSPWDDALKAYIDEAIAEGGGGAVYEVPSQGEAEAGTATTARVWTAERVKQAILALAPGGGGGGAVDSVNGQTGVVVLDHTDVGAASAAQGGLADTAVQPGALADVATSGDYNDLTGTPTLAAVATTGAYSDLSGAPSIPSDPGDIGAATAAQGALADTAVQPGDLATVATSGAYGDLSGRPTLVNVPRYYEVTTATAIGTAAKTATIGGGYAYTDGDLISVIATNGNVAASPTLNIDGLGAKGIFLGGQAASLYSAALVANGRWFLRYDAATDRFDLYGMSSNYDLISQATMEAGTSTIVGFMTPQRVAQAIAALAPGAPKAPNTQTGSYTLALTDAEKRVRYNSGSAGNITIPTNTSVPFPIGTRIEVAQVGTGQATVIPVDGSVTVVNASSAATRAQHSVLVLYKDSTNGWTVSGDMQ